MKIGIGIGIVAVLAACSSSQLDETAAPVAAAETDVVVAAESAPTPSRDLLPSDRIYYDLTHYEWYAKGQPLNHQGTGYLPKGVPVAAAAAEMDRVGEYEGVEYYRRPGTGDLLYVPVFDGYWLAFRPTEQPLARAD